MTTNNNIIFESTDEIVPLYINFTKKAIKIYDVIYDASDITIKMDIGENNTDVDNNNYTNVDTNNDIETNNVNDCAQLSADTYKDQENDDNNVINNDNDGNNNNDNNNAEKHIITYNDYLNLVKNDGCYLKDIPEEFFTYELLFTALSTNGYALKYIIKSPLLNEDLCLIAVNNNPFALKFVPEHYRSNKLIEIAMEKNPWVIKYLKEKNQWFRYIEKCPEILKYFDNDLNTYENYNKYLLAALCKNSYILKYIKPRDFILEYGIAALFHSEKNLDFILDENSRNILYGVKKASDMMKTIL
jgi:hypothetical protein